MPRRPRSGRRRTPSERSSRPRWPGADEDQHRRRRPGTRRPSRRAQARPTRSLSQSTKPATRWRSRSPSTATPGSPSSPRLLPPRRPLLERAQGRPGRARQLAPARSAVHWLQTFSATEARVGRQASSPAADRVDTTRVRRESFTDPARRRDRDHPRAAEAAHVPATASSSDDRAGRYRPASRAAPEPEVVLDGSKPAPSTRCSQATTPARQTTTTTKPTTTTQPLARDDIATMSDEEIAQALRNGRFDAMLAGQKSEARTFEGDGRR